MSFPVENHETLLPVLADELDDGEGVVLDEGVVVTRQSTERPLFAVFVDDDCVTIFDASLTASTTSLARKIRNAAAIHRGRDGDGETVAGEGVDLDTPAFQ